MSCWVGAVLEWPKTYEPVPAAALGYPVDPQILP